MIGSLLAIVLITWLFLAEVERIWVKDEKERLLFLFLPIVSVLMLESWWMAAGLTLGAYNIYIIFLGNPEVEKAMKDLSSNKLISILLVNLTALVGLTILRWLWW